MENLSLNCSKEDKYILVNFDLDIFRNIPRTAFNFEVRPVPGFEDKVDAEYLLIKPDFTGTTSADRFTNPYMLHNPVSSQRITTLHSRLSSMVLKELIQKFRNILVSIRSIADPANERLRNIQQERFIRRASLLEDGVTTDESTDEELSKAFFKEFESVCHLIDERTVLARSIMYEMREKSLIQQGEAVRHHAKTMGVGATLPSFLLKHSRAGKADLSTEEKEWIKDPTISWIPRPVGASVIFKADEESPVPLVTEPIPFSLKSEVEFFELPAYLNYKAMLPVFGHRSLPNQDIYLHFSLHPYTYAFVYRGDDVLM